MPVFDCSLARSLVYVHLSAHVQKEGQADVHVCHCMQLYVLTVAQCIHGFGPLNGSVPVKAVRHH
eukprot:11214841-Lingulodinium_polyedra.AAC.1